MCGSWHTNHCMLISLNFLESVSIVNIVNNFEVKYAYVCSNFVVFSLIINALSTKAWKHFLNFGKFKETLISVGKRCIWIQRNLLILAHFETQWCEFNTVSEWDCDSRARHWIHNSQEIVCFQKIQKLQRLECNIWKHVTEHISVHF